jgi:hypothetical protein
MGPPIPLRVLKKRFPQCRPAVYGWGGLECKPQDFPLCLRGRAAGALPILLSLYSYCNLNFRKNATCNNLDLCASIVACCGTPRRSAAGGDYCLPATHLGSCTA